MGKLKFTFTNILFWIGVIFSVLIFEDISFFKNGNPGDFMNAGLSSEQFFLFFSIATLAYIGLIVYDSTLNKAKLNIPALVILLVFLGCGITGIMLFNGMTFDNGSPELIVTDYMKLRHCLSFTLFVISLYCTYYYFVRNHPSLKRHVYIYIVIILLVYFFIIFSLATELNKYIIVANVGDGGSRVSIRSLFLNENMFAGFILMGVCAAIALNYFKKNVFSIVTIIGFTVVQIFVCSLTSTAITSAIVFLYFLSEVIFAFKKKKFSAMWRLALFLTVTISLMLIFIMCQKFEVQGLSAFCRYVYREVITANFATVSDRTLIWNNAIIASNRNIFTLLFGYGFKNSHYVIGGMLPAEGFNISCHNGYLQLLVNYGVAGLAVFASFIVFYYYCLIRLMKKHLRFSLIFLIIGIAYHALAVSESLIAFDCSAQGLLIGALFYLPVISKYKHLRKQEVCSYVLETKEKPVLLKPALVTREVSRIFLILLGAASILFAVNAYRNDSLIFYILINIVTMLGIGWLTIPYLCGIWAKSGSRAKFATQLMIFIILMFGVTDGLLASYYYVPGILPGYQWSFPIALAIIIAGEVIVYGISFKGDYKLYLNTFIAFKNVIGSFIGLAAYGVSLYFVNAYISPIDPITITSLLVLALLIPSLFSFVVPFKDLKESIENTWMFDGFLIKKHIIKDQLEEAYEI